MAVTLKIREVNLRDPTAPFIPSNNDDQQIHHRPERLIQRGGLYTPTTRLRYHALICLWTQPPMAFLFVGLFFCFAARFPASASSATIGHCLVALPLPFANRCCSINRAGDHRGLAPLSSCPCWAYTSRAVADAARRISFETSQSQTSVASSTTVAERAAPLRVCVSGTNT